MYSKLVLVILLVLCLSGCATTRRGYNTQLTQLQSRINSLEADLHEKDKTIDNLESELEKIESSNLKSQDNDTTNISTKQVQMALKNAGFYNGPIDGKIGPKTKESIKAFQKDNNLKPDGVIGKKTRLCLKKYL